MKKKHCRDAFLLAAWLGLTVGAGLASGEDAARATPERITIGAIRWDAWFDDKVNPYEKNLADKKWHGRLPFFAKAISDTEVEVHGDNQETVDREIAFAKAGGIDYFAFIYYWKGARGDGFEHDNVNRARRLYLESMHKRDINFWLIVYPRQNEDEIREWLDMMQEPNYQKGADGRPLLYMMFWDNSESPERIFGSMDTAQQHIDSLRRRIMATGQKNPYIVAMTQSPAAWAAAVAGAGIDAIGACTSFGGADYAGMFVAHRKYWDAMKATGKKVVPNLTAGWGGPRDNMGDKLQPTPAQLADHVRTACAWVDANPDVAEAKTMLFYAWNEIDEGGWLVPDKGQGTAKLDAIRDVVRERNR